MGCREPFLLGSIFLKLGLAELRIPRGVAVASIGIVVLVIGYVVFDNAYDSVGSVMLDKKFLVLDKVVPAGQSINSSIPWDGLFDHSILIVKAAPVSSQVRLHVDEPGGGTFDKETGNGYAYHIIGKSPQQQGPYSFVVSNGGSEPATVSVILGEDPYLSGKCTENDQYLCYAIPATIVFVIGGMLALIIGSLIAVSDFRKGRRPQQAK